MILPIWFSLQKFATSQVFAKHGFASVFQTCLKRVQNMACFEHANPAREWASLQLQEKHIIFGSFYLYLPRISLQK